MATTFHIVLDMDEVTVDLHTPWEKWIQENGDPDFKMSKVKRWSIHHFSSLGNKVYDFLAIPGIFLNLAPKQNSIKIINKLRLKHKITFCTSPPKNHPNAEEEKIEWLKDKFKWFNPETDIVFSHNKGEVDGDILFDDRAKWCFDFPGIAICMDAPYNKNFEGYRVQNWDEFYNKITLLAKHLG